MARAARKAARPCGYFKADGGKCAKNAREGSDWCGQCAHLDGQTTNDAATVAPKAGVKIAAQRMAKREDDYDRVRSSVPGPNLIGTDTGALIDGSRSRVAQALRSRSELATAKGPAAVAARDQADAALNEYASWEDAIRQRHPDPYGAAVTTSIREDAGGPVSDKAHVRRWLADNPEANADTIHQALNDIAEGTTERAELERSGILAPGQPVKGSDVDGLNRLAATRAVHLRDQSPTAEAEYHHVESWWRRAHPSKQPVTA